ncbi:MAG TPA: metal ABC transporter permease [Gemmataceae bacterium]|nr:metal ABC transporter permease [Gemmataceae bacterium]
MATCWLAQAVGVLAVLFGAQEDVHWLDRLIREFTALWPEWSYFSLDFQVRSLLAVLLASLVCGAVGSLVVGNRMAFFSDALAHCAFAGIALGFLFALLSGVRDEQQFWALVTPIMIVFGIVVGVGIAWVREQTNLASDTVIGVFFAGAIGFAALLRKVIRSRRLFNLEDFLFGDPVTVSAGDLVFLFVLVAITAALLVWMYNDVVFTSFNASLARSRRVRVRLCNYAFIVLLALIVNVCLKTVGVLLINALLIVPAATVGNVARNMRQLFWGTIVLCLLISVFGVWLSYQVTFPNPNNPRDPIQFGIGGTMIVSAVVLFFLSMAVEPLRRRLSPLLAHLWRRRGPEVVKHDGAKV